MKRKEIYAKLATNVKYALLSETHNSYELTSLKGTLPSSSDDGQNSGQMQATEVSAKRRCVVTTSEDEGSGLDIRCNESVHQVHKRKWTQLERARIAIVKPFSSQNKVVNDKNRRSIAPYPTGGENEYTYFPISSNESEDQASNG